ncbi:MAG: stage II sporulation protein P [Clostridia bacterium]|nr:stage II sporulation protein P [Clostridia bacterium]
MKRILCLILGLLVLLPLSCPAESIEDDGSVYRMIDLNGEYITSRAGRIYVNDEYISSDNRLYVVVQVDDAQHTAVAAHVGDEPPVNLTKAQEVFAAAAADAGPRRLICMYSTHSDESYVPTDGEASLLEDAGIHDVTAAFKKELEKYGIEVILDTTSHLPHDAKAYSRSRRTAEELMKESPDALLDIHRDGIPDKSEYETEVDGEETSKIRLLVGRSNPNADANREFAKQIKEVADEKYDGLIKDIFIGKGNYNQELYPQAILLEFGTHTLDKDLVLNSTPLMADVMNTVLYGDSASASPSDETSSNDEKNKAGGSGILWLVIVAAVGGLVYALISTGTLGNLGSKLKSGFNEVTGGALGKNKKRK